MRKVLVTSTSFAKTSKEPIKLLEDHGWTVVFHNRGNLTDEEMAAVIPGYEAVIVGTDRISQCALQAADKLKVVLVHGTGMDSIDMKATEEHNIPVYNAAHQNARGVAECAFALLLSFIRQIAQAEASVKQGEWKGSAYIGTELCGKTLGIIGLGHIGRMTASIAKGFQMEIQYYDVYRNQDAEKEDGIVYQEMEELLRTSDVIALHLPLLPETRGIIGKQAFEMMKEDAILVNIARGGIVDEDALFDALSAGQIRGAILDVIEKEPLPMDSALRRLNNIMITPHIGGYTIESVTRNSMCVANKLVEVLP